MSSKGKNKPVPQPQAVASPAQALSPVTVRGVFLEHKAHIAILALLSILLYILSVNNGYNLDDFLVTKDHPAVSKGIAGIPEILTSPYYNERDMLMDYRPVAQISFAIERSIFGDSPGISHFFNVLLYMLICMVLFVLLHIIFPALPRGLLWLGSLVFTVHPLHAEVVNNLKSRDELFSLLFGLLFFWMVVRDMRTPAMRFKLWSVVFLVLSLMSKVSVLPLILFLPVYVLFTSREKLLTLSVWIRPAIYILFWVVYFLVMNRVVFPTQRMFSFTEMPMPGDPELSDHLNVIIPTIYFYIKMMIVPFPLSSYYGFNTLPPDVYKTLAVLVFLAVSAWLFYKGFKQRMFYALLVTWFFASGFSFFNVGYYYAGIVSERAAFIMSIPGSLAVVMLAGLVVQQRDISLVGPGKATHYVVYGLAVVYGLISFSRVGDWKDQFTLFSKDIRHYPESGQLNYLLGVQYDLLSKKTTAPDLAGRYLDTAFTHFNKALSADRYRTDAIAYIGRYYIDRYNNYDAAREVMLRAWDMKQNGEIAYELARTSVRFGMWDEAITLLEFTTKNDTAIYWAWYFLAQAYFEKGRVEDALSTNERLPSYPALQEPYHLNAATFSARLNNMEAAASHMREAVVLGNRDPRLLEILKSYYLDVGDKESLSWLESLDH